ncbi:MAG TPA: hypothetical protein VGM89_11675, partial [Puia sp.]
MSNLKDTDFDDLFRRASDKYPLRTDSSDWDRMAAALEKDPSPDTSGDADNPDKRRRRRLFWWFLLLPLAGIGYFVTHNGGHGTAAPVTGRENGVAITKPAAANDNGRATTTPNANGTPDAKATDNTSQNTTPNTKGGDASGDARHNTEPSVTTTTPTLAGGLAGAGMPRKAPRMVNSINPKKSGKGIRSAGEDVPVQPGIKTEAETIEGNQSNDRFADKTMQIDPKTNPIAAAFTLHTLNRARLTDPYALNVKVNAPETKPAAKKDSTKQKQAKKPYLYAGLLAAPDLSTVKLQSTKGVGTT